MKRALALAAAVLAACGSSAPRMHPPDRIDAFCGRATPNAATVTSILSSVADRLEPGADVPSRAELEGAVRLNGGAIAHWTAQPMFMPNTAAALGVGGDYLDVTDLVIDDTLAGPDWRLIYATVTTPNGPKTVALRAYDVRNVCTAKGAAPASQ